ncbi:MAG: acyl-CoA dehydrogenase [Chloroflexi bacterium]|nr:acyl-CoA dehydrogenase [Chloroflexota bacterium]
MDFRLTSDQEAFVGDVRRFLDAELTPEAVEEVASEERMGPNAKAVLLKMAQRGWLSLHWPKDYHGGGRTAMERFLLTDELAYRGAPGAANSNTGGRIVAPTLTMFGTREQCDRFLPPIARGEIDFALGYTEPNAGSDLANLQMRADLDGDAYVVTGTKFFNTACHYAEYHWLAVRTDQSAPKHKGISLMMVDLKSPGIEIRPIWTMAGDRTNAVSYDRVRVPRGNVVGEPGQGFYYMAKALEFERMFVSGDLRRYFEQLLAALKQERAKGRDRLSDPLVRHSLAQLAVEMQIVRLFTYRVAWALTVGRSPGRESSIVKLFKTDLAQKMARAGIHALGLHGQLEPEAPHAPMRGRAERYYLQSVSASITGGSSEVQRNVIAQRGLGLPR